MRKVLCMALALLCACMLWTPVMKAAAAGTAGDVVTCYTVYSAPTVSLVFEGPAGWLTDDSAEGCFVLRNPVPEEGCQATLSVTAEQIARPYSENEMRQMLRTRLNAVGDEPRMAEFDCSMIAERNLLGVRGFYANYYAQYTDGTQVSGRMHAACVDQKLYLVHVIAPKSGWEAYKSTLYDQFRRTAQVSVPVVSPKDWPFRLYQSEGLALKFEGPYGWRESIVEPDSDWLADAKAAFCISLENPGVEAGSRAQLTICAAEGLQYDMDMLTRVVQSMLGEAENAARTVEFTASRTVARDLMGHRGAYAEYIALLDNGTEVRGCVHAICAEDTVYTVRMTAAGSLWVEYEGLRSQFRDTVTLMK
ncbi:MAG: hypothetical protein IJ343_10955 [Clostridia bacterium]|nr:hypothetical protein [Clostridia bacterium]